VKLIDPANNRIIGYAAGSSSDLSFSALTLTNTAMSVELGWGV